MLYFSTLLISFFITITLIPIFRRAAVRLHAMDLPNPRKVHGIPIPKCGGLGMALGTGIPVIILSRENPQLASMLAGSAIIVLFGLLDDFFDVSYKFKFVGQIAAALLVILNGGICIESLGMLLPDNVIMPAYVALPLTLITIVGVTNAINLSDGLDGLAGGISMLGFALIGYLSIISDKYFLAIISFAMLGAIFGFLRFNSHPARLFMGDAGSQLLGFLTITLSLSLTQDGGPYNVIIPLMIAGYPVLDTLRVMTRRIMEGRNPFSADKNHLHHRLMGMGFYHAEAVFLIYVFQAGLIILGYLFRYHSEWIMLGLYLFASMSVMSALKIAKKRNWEIKRGAFAGISAFKNRVIILIREKNIIIKLSFGLLKYSLPCVFFILCLITGEMPFHLSLISLTATAILVVLLLFKRRLVESGIRLSLYLTIPFILYYSSTDASGWFGPVFARNLDLCLPALAVPAGLTMRFTRRKQGFRTSPMDFLIFFIAIAIALVPDLSDISDSIRLIAVKIMVLFFSYEVLIGELRGKVEALGWFTAGTLIALSLI